MAKRQFGVSTHLYHNHRLSREHLLEIAAHGFETVEVFATRTHFDFHNPAAIGDLQQWLGEAGLSLHGIHAPIGENYRGGRWGAPLTIASADAGESVKAPFPRISYDDAVQRLRAKGLPRSQLPSATDNSRDGARRSIEALADLAAPLGVKVAVEVIPNELSRAGSLVHFIEADLDRPDVGVCLDFGHAHLEGDLVDTIEIVSEHLATTDVHDNHGRADDHLIPFEGTIDWPGALTGIQKVGYEGPLMLELAGQGPAKGTLARARRARDRMDRLLAT